MMQQGLNRSPQPGNPTHQPNLTQQTPQSIVHKLDLMPVRDLEMRVASWREHMTGARARMQELLAAVSRPGAPPEVAAAFTRAKHEFEQHNFLFGKSQEILARKLGQAQAQAQAHAQAQAQARMTPNLGEPARPGRSVNFSFLSRANTYIEFTLVVPTEDYPDKRQECLGGQGNLGHRARPKFLHSLPHGTPVRRHSNRHPLPSLMPTSRANKRRLSSAKVGPDKPLFRATTPRLSTFSSSGS